MLQTRYGGVYAPEGNDSCLGKGSWRTGQFPAMSARRGFEPAGLRAVVRADQGLFDGVADGQHQVQPDKSDQSGDER
jgi:hypothetical protein